ncbi:MAG TPA: iron-containing alcohol dehydrogenase, partial [Vicinamibacterales bacterium]|nr:iron-containing alcohol dehydrogenase [Vicinamibacterales bacterium]
MVFADGASRALGRELERRTWRRAFVITTAGRARSTAGLLTDLAGIVVGRFDRAVQHVPIDDVDVALQDVRRVDADVLIAIGGGSPIGLAKAIALATSLPIAAVPTTYAGSEMTGIWGITDREGKRTGRDARVAPALVVYDPALTLDLPAEVSAASGMNAIA